MQSSLLITSFADQRCDPIFIDKTGMLSYLNEAIDSLNTTIQPLKNFVEMFGGKK